MARFRDNTRQTVVDGIYRRQGLKVERVSRFDETVLLADSETWSCWSFQMTLNGTRYVRHADRSYTLAPSTMFWTSPLDVPVKTYGLAGTRSNTVLLTFSAQRWQQFVDGEPLFKVAHAGMLAVTPRQPVLALQFATPQIVHVLRRLLTVNEAGNASPLVYDNYVRLLLRLIAQLRFEEHYRRHDHEQRRRVEAAQARICAALTAPPDLEELAAELHVSLRQLQRDFVSLTRLTPVKYRNIIRLSEANTLLAETSLPIATIAAELGYPSLSHFSAAFRQLYHCSPREVREGPYHAKMGPEETGEWYDSCEGTEASNAPA